MSVDWADARAKIARWIAAGGGIANGAVVFAGQGGPAPKDDGNAPFPEWVSVKILATNGIGTDWTREEENPLVLADDVVETVDAVANTLTLTAHAYQTGDGPVNFTTAGALPTGIAVDTDYWLVRVDANTVKLTASRAAAVAVTPGPFVDIASAGSGAATIHSTEDTRRVLEDIVFNAEGNRTAVLSIQCYSTAPVDGLRGQAILERLRASVRLPGQQGILRSSGFALALFGAVTTVGGSASGAALLEPRAVCEATLNYVDGASEAAAAIERVQVEATIHDQSGDVVDVATFDSAPGPWSDGFSSGFGG